MKIPGSKKWFLIWLLIMLIGVSPVIPQSQEHEVNALLRQLKSATTDTVRAGLWARLAIMYSDAGDCTNTMQSSRRSFLLYQRLEDKYGMSRAYHTMGIYYMNHHAPELAEKEYKKALLIIQNDSEKQSQNLRARILGNMSILAMQNGEASESIRLLLLIVPIFEKNNDDENLAKTYRIIANRFYSYQDHHKAALYYRKYLYTSLKTNKQELIYDAYLLNADNMLSSGHLDSAAAYLAIANRRYPDIDAGLKKNYYLELARYHQKKQSYEKALFYVNQAEVAGMQYDQAFLSNVLMARTEIFQAQENYPKALDAARRLYETDTVSDSQYVMQILKNLAFLEEKNGHPARALYYLKKYMSLEEEENKKEAILEMHDLEMKYQTSQKEKDILILQNQDKQHKIDLQQKKFMNQVLFMSISALVLLLILVYILYRIRKNLADKKEESYLQRIKGLEKEKRLVSYGALIEGQEQERIRLSMDLHDGLSGMLSGILMQLSAFKKDRNNQNMEQIIGHMNEAIQEVRHIAHDIMPAGLLKYGLNATLEEMCKRFRSDKINVIYQSYKLNITIPQKKQIMIYRLIQEMVTNAVRHSEARTILVQCILDENTLNIIVEDDGKGFDVSLFKQAKGIGYENIVNRVNFLKGKINIQSQPDIGTTFNIQCSIHD